MGFKNEATGDGSVSVGNENKSTNIFSNAFGFKNVTAGNDSIVLGTNNNISMKESLAFGVGHITGNGYDYVNEGYDRKSK